MRSVVSVFGGNYCNIEKVLESLLQKTGFRIVADADIIEAAHREFDSPKTQLEKVFSSDHLGFNPFTHQRKYYLAQLKQVLARYLLEGEALIVSGFSGPLIPRRIQHNLRVCLIADVKSRIANAMRDEKVSKNQALEKIRRSDEICVEWLHSLYQTDDPWSSSLYDIVAPTDKFSADDIANLVQENLQHLAVQPNDTSWSAVQDFSLAARVEVKMLGAGHDVSAETSSGSVNLMLNRPVLMQERLISELEAILEKVPGVNSYRIMPGRQKTDGLEQIAFPEPHHRIMLVDDEREFVQTLSERLMTRHIPTMVTYSGEAALEQVRERTPEIMILDLKMPGIDGIEVLKRVKKEHPEVEVIILTGRGTDADRDACMALGAFAYLEKPVDIEKLSEKIRQIYQMGGSSQHLGK